MRGDPLSLCLFGAPLDTGNRGVEALGRSVLAGIAAARPGSRVAVFDNGWGVRSGTPGPYPAEVEVELVGVRRSRRYHRRESWTNVLLSQRLGGLGNPVAERLRASDAVLDISGGDSFSDVYGPTRLATVLAPKHAALRAGRPLVLLPQTYGPFTDPGARARAQRVVRAAALAYSRDPDSHAVLLDLLGAQADPARHRAGVDVAFALPSRDPGPRLPEDLRAALEERLGGRPIAGVNVSGLIWDSARAAASFGLVLDYRATVTALVQGLLAAGSDVILVPHVRDVAHSRESDMGAAAELHVGLSGADRGRVHVAPDDLAADEAKWVIGRCDWFCGTRMHATIAGLSQGVPTAALAYSLKTRGVFNTCEAAGEVVEARSTTTPEAVEQLVDAFARRTEVAALLARTVPPVRERAADQVADICSWVAGQGRSAAAVRQ